jgi:hypothetical protein
MNSMQIQKTYTAPIAFGMARNYQPGHNEAWYFNFAKEFKLETGAVFE